jgi:hypothetical protein
LRVTNIANLPQSVYNVITYDDYSKGESDYSVTTLLKPPQMVHLTDRYWDKLEEDALDRVWSLFGKACHFLLEKHGDENSIKEERLYIDIDGIKVGGQVDCYHSNIVTDYKITSAWTILYNSRVKEWEEQLNLYALIFRANGYEVNQLQIVAILRDWDKNKARSNKDYPQSPIEIIPITLWSEQKQLQFITEKIKVLKLSKFMDDSTLAEYVPCHSEDMWEQPTKYAIMKKGRKSAVRVFDSQKECFDFGISATEYIQKRLGKRTRCEEYCPVTSFCHQYKQYKSEQINNEEG